MSNGEHSTFEMPKGYDSNVNLNDGDGSDGYDGSRDRANVINVVTATATSQEEIISNSIDKVQGTIPGAITPVTPVESGMNIVDTQTSFPPTTDLQQAQSTKSETIQNAGDIYMSGANWYCRHCKLSGDKFYMEVHICKGYIPM